MATLEGLIAQGQRWQKWKRVCEMRG